MYRILTEDKNRSSIYELLDACGFDGCTIVPATGFWKGQQEQSIAIEIETDDITRIREFADDIKFVNKQESVLIQHIVTDAEFV